MAERPNIVLLMSDQHRSDALGCAGNPYIRTPNLDRLAAEGVRFETAVCTSPLCMPSRATIATGLYAHAHGIRDNGAGNLPAFYPTFMRSLQQAGYHTAVVGKMHFATHGRRDSVRRPDIAHHREHTAALGFHDVHETEGKMMSEWTDGPWTRYLAARGLLEQFREDYRRRRTELPCWYAEPSVLSEEDHQDAYIGREGVRWLEQYDGGRPFFLWVSWAGPHDPWDAPGRFATMYRPEELPLPIADPLARAPACTRRRAERHGLARATPLELRRMKASYYGLISLNDYWIGRILEVLERRGWLDNTVIVYTSDHGEMLGDHGLIQKSTFYEQAVRVPFIVRWPARFPQGVVAREMVELIDLPATLMDLAGATIYPACQGRSLVPFLEQPERVEREAVFSELNAQLMVRTSRYKYVYRPDEEIQELYDLEADPQELNNLAGLPAYAAVEHDLRTRLLDWMATTARPVTTKDMVPHP
jgi:choline-sulfatase